jgi:XTP/dITP diphosphohydrolase
MKEIFFASNNPGKVAEIKAILGPSFAVSSPADLGITGELRETGNNLEANALEKARYFFEKLKMPVFADDSGLEVAALDGRPGVNSADYAGAGRNSLENMLLLLRELENAENRKAKFVAVIAYVDRNGEHLFRGEIAGKIAPGMKGNHGFGYDPLFIPEGLDRTFAELGEDIKNTLSHRKLAVNKLVEFLTQSENSAR